MKDFSVLQMWVDASYATHPDMRSHTGGAISLGHGVINSKSSKHKINTKSSTEAELVGASDFVSHTMWTSWFLKDEGYIVESNIFTKIIKVPSYLRKTVGVHVERNLDTLILGIFLSRMSLEERRSRWLTVLLKG